MISKVRISMCSHGISLTIRLTRNTNRFHFGRLLSSRRFSSASLSVSKETCFDAARDAAKYYSAEQALYPITNDTTIQAIKNCASSEELGKFVDNASNLNKQQLCQLIVMLGDSMKLHKNPHVRSDEILFCLTRFLDEMTIKEASCCFHYLHYIGGNVRAPVMAALTEKVINQKISGEHPLEFLTHFTFGLKSDRSLYSDMIAAALIPQVSRVLDDCRAADDLYLLTICLINISHVLPISILDRFKSKVDDILNKRLLKETPPETILKIIYFLNYSHWSFRNTTLIRKLLLQLENHIKYLDTKALISINQTFYKHTESMKIVPLLVKRAQELLEQEPNVELLHLAVLKVSPEQRVKIAEKLRKSLITVQISSLHSDALQTVFKILRLLKISDLDICDNLWRKILNDVYATTEPNLHYILTKYVYKYMFFNNSLGGTYRHVEFESEMIAMLMVELKKTMIPRNFAMFSSFIIAYSEGTDQEKIPQFIVDKIEMLHGQFSIRDSIQISRGVEILLLTERQKHGKIPDRLKLQLDKINDSLGKSAERHLKIENLHLSELNGIIRAFNTRKASKDCRLFYEMINRYNSVEKFELSSRSLKEIASNLENCNFCMDLVCEKMVDYTLENWEHMTGDTVEKILTHCFNFSYFPEKLDFFDRCCEIIVRDLNYMNGLSIVQATLALVFYKTCPLQLISMVLSTDFMSRIEQEIAMCFYKNSYPQRIMNEVMKLNRAACLDCPEVNVRWFQQSSIKTQSTKIPAIMSQMQADIKDILLSFVGNPEYLRVDWVTPYGYRIDFELNTDQYDRFVRPPPEDYHHVYVDINYKPHINKIAVLILSSKMFCDNDLNRLKGAEFLRMQHLEMLGYRVVHVKAHDLNSFFKNFAAKTKHLKKLLQLSL